MSPPAPSRIEEGKIAVCTNWISPSFQPPAEAERAQARHRLGLPTDALILGYVGRLSGDKLGETLLRAFASALRDAPCEVRLIIAGDGWKADEWRETARHLGIARRVHFVGWQKEPRMIYARPRRFRPAEPGGGISTRHHGGHGQRRARHGPSHGKHAGAGGRWRERIRCGYEHARELRRWLARRPRARSGRASRHGPAGRGRISTSTTRVPGACPLYSKRSTFPWPAARCRRLVPAACNSCPGIRRRKGRCGQNGENARYRESARSPSAGANRPGGDTERRRRAWCRGQPRRSAGVRR